MEELRDPPGIHWPGYFWVLNDRIDEAALLAQLRDMRRQGARSVCLLPEPPEFRPNSLATRLDRPYLSKTYFDMIRKIVGECRRLGMNYWLYDEGGWPSGGACGQVCAQDPGALAGQVIVASESGPVIENISYGCVPYPNILNIETAKTFIALTHEGYKKAVGEFFGSTIRFAFTDEPLAFSTRPGQLTWTGDMAEVFKQRKGYDLCPHLAELLKPPANDEPRELANVRVDFYDVWSQLFVERYLVPIRDWCRANNLLSGGHMGGEDEPSGNARHGFGHILRALRGLDLPGIDVIWRQLFPGLRSHQFPKYASSVARQKGQPFVLTESFAIYGNGLTPAQMKWITDQQFVRGASLMVGSYYPYSTRDHLLAGGRPHFGPGNPLWKYMDIYHAYTARLSYLLTRGQPVCSVAVYYDIRSIWAGGCAAEQAAGLHDRLADTLLKAQCDFDYIDDDILAGIGASVADGNLVVGPMRYATVVVPATKWMAPEALKNLAGFVRSGGKLIAVDALPLADGGKTGLPDYLDKKYEERISRIAVDQAPSLLHPLVKLEPVCPDIRVCRRNWEKTTLYFLTNEADRTIRLNCTFYRQGTPVLVQLETGECFEPAFSTSGEHTILELEFAPWGSVVVLFGVEHAALLPAAKLRRELVLDGKGWTLRPLRQYRIGEHDLEAIELDRKAVPVDPGDWAACLSANFSGDAEYAFEFHCDVQHAGQPAFLDLGRVNYVCQVFLNEHEVGRKIWPPFVFDLKNYLHTGSNRVRVVVANTLANAILDPAVEARWNARKGITWPPAEGFTYDKMAREFEPDSLSSGLFGPVKVLFAEANPDFALR